MRAIAKRLAALEQIAGLGGRVARWVRIIADGKTTYEARAEYEAENGPIAADTGIIYRSIVTPERSPDGKLIAQPGPTVYRPE